MFTTMNACPKVTSASVTPRNRRMLIAVSISAWPLSLRVLSMACSSGSPDSQTETQLFGMRPPRAGSKLCAPQTLGKSLGRRLQRCIDVAATHSGATPEPRGAPRSPAQHPSRSCLLLCTTPQRAHADSAGTGDGASPSGAMLTPPPPAAIIARRDAHPPDLADALPARRIPPQDHALLDERHHPALPEGAHAAAKPGHLHRRADGRPRPRARRARGGRGRPHRHGAADPPRLRPGRPLPRARQAGRPRGDVGVARPRGVPPPRRRGGRGRGGVRLAGRARRPRGRALARHLPRRALARPRGPARHRLVEPAVAQGRRLPHELALSPVFLLAGLLLARLPAPVRVLRRADLLRPELPHP